MIPIEVNGKEISAKEDETILVALERAGIKIPTLCYMKDLAPTGACRLCVVEVEGFPNLVPSCSHPVQEGMKIHTRSPEVLRARRVIIEHRFIAAGLTRLGAGRKTADFRLISQKIHPTIVGVAAILADIWGEDAENARAADKPHHHVELDDKTG